MEGIVYMIDQRTEGGKGRETRREALRWRSWEDSRDQRSAGGAVNFYRIEQSEEQRRKKKLKGGMMRESI